MTRGQLPKAFLRLDPDIDQKHPDNLEGFVRLLCAANRQVPRGRFGSRAVLDRIFGKAAVVRLAKRGDILTAPDGSVTVPGWQVWQEGDFTVADRMRRYRESRGAIPTISPSPTVTNGVTPTVTDTVTPPSPTSEASRRLGVKASRRPPDAPLAREALANGDDQASALWARHGLPHIDPGTAAVLEEITGRHAGSAGDRQLTELDRLIEDHGPDVVQAALRTVADGRRMTARQLIWPVVKYLEPMAQVPVETDPDPADVRAQLRGKRTTAHA